MTDSSPTHALRIGALSSLTRLSVRMLRHYDAHGVLVPAATDPFSGYRLYAPEQVADALFIRQLRDVGFGVASIAALLPLRSDPAALGRALALQRDQLIDEAAAAERRVADLDQLMTHLQEETMSTIITTTVPGVRVAALRMTIPNYPAEGVAWERIMGQVGRQQISILPEPCGATFHDDGYQEGEVDIEVWVPIAADAEVSEPLRALDLPTQHVVTTQVKGPYENLGPASDELARYVADQGLRPTGPMFNRYLVGPMRAKDPADYLSEVCIPIG